MSSKQVSPEPPSTEERSAAASRTLDAIAWGVFMIWVGIAFLMDVGWGWGLVGVAAIILGAAVIRWMRHLNLGGFWVAVGLMFLAGGLWELLDVRWPLAPVLIIGCGVAVLWGALRGKHLTRE